MLGGRAHDLAHVNVAADRAGVDTHAGRAALERHHGQPPIVVDVGDDRQRSVTDDLGEGLGVGRRGQRHSHELAAGRRQRPHLLECRTRVAGRRVGHGLHHDRRATADGDAADVDLPRVAHDQKDTTRPPSSPSRRAGRAGRRGAVMANATVWRRRRFRARPEIRRRAPPPRLAGERRHTGVSPERAGSRARHSSAARDRAG